MMNEIQVDDGLFFLNFENFSNTFRLIYDSFFSFESKSMNRRTSDVLNICVQSIQLQNKKKTNHRKCRFLMRTANSADFDHKS